MMNILVTFNELKKKLFTFIKDLKMRIENIKLIIPKDKIAEIM